MSREDKIWMSKDWIKIVRKDYLKVNKSFLMLDVDISLKYTIFKNLRFWRIKIIIIINNII